MGLASDVVRRGGERSGLGAVGAIVAGGALAVTAGPLGVPIGLLVVGAWVLLSVPYVLAAGHLGVVILFPDGPALGALALVEAGFVLVLVGPFARQGADPRIPAAALVVLLALSGVVAAGLRWLDSLPLTALALAVAATLLGYGLHRYELLRLGLVEP